MWINHRKTGYTVVSSSSLIANRLLFPLSGGLRVCVNYSPFRYIPFDSLLDGWLIPTFLDDPNTSHLQLPTVPWIVTVQGTSLPCLSLTAVVEEETLPNGPAVEYFPFRYHGVFWTPHYALDDPPRRCTGSCTDFYRILPTSYRNPRHFLLLIDDSFAAVAVAVGNRFSTTIARSI